MARKKQTKKYKKERLLLAKKLVSQNYGREVLSLIRKKYAVYCDKSDLQAEVYAFLVKEGFSYREIAKVTGKTHEAVRHAIKSSQLSPPEAVPPLAEVVSLPVGEAGKQEAERGKIAEKTEPVVVEEKEVEPVKAVQFFRKEKNKSSLHKVAESLDAIDKTLYGSVFPSLHQAREYLPVETLAEPGVAVDEEEEEIDQPVIPVPRQSAGQAPAEIQEDVQIPVSSNKTLDPRRSLPHALTRGGDGNKSNKVFVWSGTAKELKKKLSIDDSRPTTNAKFSPDPRLAGRQAGSETGMTSRAQDEVLKQVVNEHIREHVPAESIAEPKVNEERTIPISILSDKTHKESNQWAVVSSQPDEVGEKKPELTLMERLNPEPEKVKEEIGSSLSTSKAEQQEAGINTIGNIPLNGVPKRKAFDSEPAKTVGEIPHLVLDTFNEQPNQKGISLHEQATQAQAAMVQPVKTRSYALLTLTSVLLLTLALLALMFWPRLGINNPLIAGWHDKLNNYLALVRLDQGKEKEQQKESTKIVFEGTEEKKENQPTRTESVTQETKETTEKTTTTSEIAKVSAHVIVEIIGGEETATTTTTDPVTGETVTTVTPTLYTAGNGISISGNQISVAGDYSGQGSISTVGSVSSGTWQGGEVQDAYVADNITASNYIPTGASFGGGVSGTYDNLVVTDDSHNHTADTMPDHDDINGAGTVDTLAEVQTVTVAGDVSGTVGAITVADDSHSHTGTTISGVDISSDTNLTGDAEIVLTDDSLSVGSGITRDTEWDTVAKIETATGADIITSAENSDGLVGTKSVNETGIAAGKVLKYNAVSGQWEMGDDNGGTSYTAGDGLDLVADEFSTDLLSTGGLQITGGELGIKLNGATLAIDASGLKVADTYDDNFLTTSTAFGGDVSGTYNAIAVTDDSHAHTTTTISGLDISDDTNLAGDTEIVLTGDVLSIASGLTRDSEWNSIAEIETATGADIITSAENNDGLVGTKSVNETGIATGKVLKYNAVSGQWEIGDDNDTNTTYTAGAGLDLTGTEFSTDLLSTGGLQTSGVDNELGIKLDGSTLTLGADGLKVTDTYDDNFLTTTTNFGGDVSGTYNAIAVTDDSHNHTTTTISGLDISDDTNLTSGNGVAVSGDAVQLAALTAEWNQTGAYDISLNNAGSELKILESTGDTYFGTLDVGNLDDNYTYTFSGASGTVWTSGNDGSGSGLDADTLDGHDTAYFMTAGTDDWVDEAGDTMTGNLTFSGAQTIYGGTSANDDITIEGTSNATRTSSYVVLQPNGGNVGIGTADPVKSLEIKKDTGSGTADDLLVLNSVNSWTGNGSGILFRNNTSGADQLVLGRIRAIDLNNWDSRMDFAVSKATALGDDTITALSLVGPDGDVGMGTTTPAARLHVIDNEASAVATLLKLHNINGATNSSLKLLFSTSTLQDSENVGAIIKVTRTNTDVSGSNDMIFQTSNGTTMADRMTIKHDGKVGINDTSPATTLEVGGTITSTGLTVSSGTVSLPNDQINPSEIAQGTAGQILISNATPDTAWVSISGDGSLAGSGALTVNDDSHSHTATTLPAHDSLTGAGTVDTALEVQGVAVGGDASGTVGTIAVTDDSHNHTGSTISGIDISDDTNLTSGNGVAVSGDAVQLAALTGNWNQTGAFDISLANAGSELSIMESVGDTYYGTLDVGNLDDNYTYTFSGASGTVWTSGNDGSGSTLDADTLDGHDTSYFMTAGTDNWVNTTGDTMTGNLTLQKADGTIVFDTVTASDTDFWMGVQDDAGGDDDDLFQIGDGTTPGTNPFLTIDTSGKVGIGEVSPGATLDVVGDIRVGTNAYSWGTGDLGVSRDTAPTTGAIYFGNTANNYLYYGGSGGFILAGALDVTGTVAINDNDGVSNDVNLTLGDANETGQIIFYDGSANTGTLTQDSLSSDAIYTFSGATGTVWTSGNDGSGSGLDADTLDGHDTSYFMTAGTDNWVNTTGDTMTGNLTLQKADGTIVFDTVTATDTDFWLGVQDDAGGDDDDLFQIGDGTTPGTNPFLTIDTSGNVGIGTTAPGAKLSLEQTGAGSTPAITFSDGGGDTDFWMARKDTDGDLGTDNDIFSIGDGLTPGTNPFLSISTSGNVGIGTTSPSEPLHVNEGYGGTSTTLLLQNSLASIGGRGTSIDFKSSDTVIAEIAGETSTASNYGSLRFFTANNGSLGEAMRITSDRYLGIGTASADRKLEVLDASNPQLRLTYTDNTVYTEFQSDGNGYLYVNATGNRVGIEDNTPSYTLDVNGDVGVADTEEYFIGSTQVLSKGNGSLTGNIVVGNGGDSLTHGSGDEGYYNTLMGTTVGTALTTGYSNLFLGFLAGNATNTGYYNVFLGQSAGYSNTSGVSNVYIGRGSGFYNSTGNYNISIGSQSGNGASGQSYSNNTFIGYQTGLSTTTGGNNFFGGYQSGYSNTTGHSNAYLGYQAGWSNQTGTYNAAMGMQALLYNTAGSNTALGGAAGYSNTSGANNVYLGTSASYFNQTGSSNTTVGRDAGVGVTGNSYSNNTFIGFQTGYSTTTGGNNFFGGYQAGFSNQTGAGNVFLGYQAGYSETGSNKLYIDNSNTASPLIYGDFSTDLLTINGAQEIDTGTGTGVAMTIDQDDTDQTALDFDINNVSGDILNIDWGGATTLTGALQGVDVDFTNVTADGTNAAYGIHVNDLNALTTSAEYGIYVQGTNWDYSVVTEGDILLNNAAAELSILESDGATYYGTLDVGNLGANATYTFSGVSGTVVTTTTEAVFTGDARHARKIQLNAEYAGAVISTFYGSGTDSAEITGNMTSDAEPSADLLRTYYEWNSSETDVLNYYTVAVRVTLPQDFDSWATNNAVQVDFDTETTDNTLNLLSVYIHNGDDTPGTAVATDTANAAAVADTWETLAIDDSVIDDGAAPDWDAAGETAVIYLRMGSQDDDFVRIGDIKLNYLSKW